MNETVPRRDVGALDAALVTVGAMIGSGIFFTPASVARIAGSTSRALMVWFLGAILTLLGALSTAELGAAIPGTGGLYVYLRRAYGPAVAFTFGWAMLVVLVPSSVAFFAGVTARHLAPILGTSETTVCLIVIALTTAFNLAGVRHAARVQSVTAIAKILGVFIVAVVAWIAPANTHAPTHAVIASGSVLSAVVPVLWAYDGWIDVTSIAGEVRDPGKVIPRALVSGVLCVAVVYLLSVGAWHRCLGTDVLALSQAPANDLGARLGGDTGMRMMAALVTVSALGGCMIGMLTGTRVIAAMGSTGDFAPSLGQLGSRATPDRAILVTSMLSVAYALSSYAQQLAEVFVVGAWPFYALGALATITLRRKEPTLPRPYRVPGYPWTVLGFFGATMLMLVSFAVESPKLVAISLGVILLGIPVWLLTRTRR
jgi:basic amino acid/polyamine antiporter, APA family